MNTARNRDRALYEGLAGAGLVFLAAAVIGKTAGIIRPDIAQMAAGCGFSVAAISGCLLQIIRFFRGVEHKDPGDILFATATFLLIVLTMAFWNGIVTFEPAALALAWLIRWGAGLLFGAFR